MTARKINDIALWLLDRVEAGRTEERGSLDSRKFGRSQVCIMKDETGFLVWLDWYAIPDFTLTDQMSLNDIRQLVANA